MILQSKPVVTAFGGCSIIRILQQSSQSKPSVLEMLTKNHCPVFSFTVDACFTYKANLASYNPRLSEWKCFTKNKNPLFYKYKICSGVLTSASLCPAAISYSVESDGDRRKQGLPSRVMFLNKSRTEADYQLNGTLDLRGQKQETCIKIMAKLKVKHICQIDKSHLQDIIQQSGAIPVILRVLEEFTER